MTPEVWRYDTLPNPEPRDRLKASERRGDPVYYLEWGSKGGSHDMFWAAMRADPEEVFDDG